LSARSRRSSRARSVPLTREALAKLKRRAWRRGVWFRDLKQSERMLLDLTIRVVQRVRSFMLAKVVSRIVDRLCEAMESRIYRLVRSEGKAMVEKLSEIAVGWGNKTARSWAEDRGFMQYVTINNLDSFGS
jgi:hypothetical protein